MTTVLKLLVIFATLASVIFASSGRNPKRARTAEFEVEYNDHRPNLSALFYARTTGRQQQRLRQSILESDIPAITEFVSRHGYSDLERILQEICTPTNAAIIGTVLDSLYNPTMNRRNDIKLTLFDSAVRQDNLELLQVLLNHDKQLFLTARKAAVDEAIHSRKYRVAEILLDSDFVPVDLTFLQFILLVLDDRVSLVEKLLKAVPTFVTARDQQLNTALHFASSKEMVTLLLANGAIVDAENRNHQTPFFLAFSDRNFEVCHALLPFEGRRKQLIDFLFNIGSFSVAFTTARSHVLESAVFGLWSIFGELPPCLYVGISFVNENGTDRGGLVRNWLSLLVERLFNPPLIETSDPEVNVALMAAVLDENDTAINYDMLERVRPFKEAPFVLKDSDSPFYVPNAAFDGPLAAWQFIGFLFVMLLRHNSCLNVKLAPSIYKLLVGQVLTFEDLRDDDPALYAQLQSLRSLDLNEVPVYFTSNPERRVTVQNLLEFYREQATQAMFARYQPFLLALKSGFDWALEYEPLEAFLTWQELANLLEGEQIVNLAELKQQIDFRGGWHHKSELFFSALDQLDNFELLQLLNFVTGRYGLPFGGVSRLESRIKVSASMDEYIRAGTCVYNLKVPLEIEDVDDLVKRLRLAINSIDEFDETNYNDNCQSTNLILPCQIESEL